MMLARIRLLFGISLFWLPLSLLFDGLNNLVLPNRLLTLGDEGSRAAWLGLLTFAGLLVGMLVQPIAGAWSDRTRTRWGRRGIMALGVALMLPALFLLGTAQHIAMLFTGFVLVQVAVATAQAAFQGYLPDRVPTASRGLAAGARGLMDLGGAMIGFLLLGALIGRGQIGLALLIVAAVAVVALLLTIALVPERRGGPAAPPSRVGLREAFHLDLRQHHAFAWLIASRFLFLLATFGIGRFLLFFVSDRLGLDPDTAAEQTGFLFAGLALVAAVVSLPAGWAADRIGRLPLMTWGALLSAGAGLLLIGVRTEMQLLLLGSLLAVGSAAFASANWAMAADLAPPQSAARFLGLTNIGTAGAAAAAGLLGPLVDWGNSGSQQMGYTLLFVVAALAFLASAAIQRAIARAIRAQPAVTGEPAPPTPGSALPDTRS